MNIYNVRAWIMSHITTVSFDFRKTFFHVVCVCTTFFDTRNIISTDQIFFEESNKLNELKNNFNDIFFKR